MWHNSELQDTTETLPICLLLLICVAFSESVCQYNEINKKTLKQTLSLMPSTRKQKAREKLSRQSDVLSDLEIVDIIIGSYSRIDEMSVRNDGDTNQDTESNSP